MNIKLMVALVAVVASVQVANVYAGDKACHGKMFTSADANNDGKLSKEEFKAHHDKRMEEKFNKIDANGDGFIEKAEKKAAHEKMKEHKKECKRKKDKVYK